MQKRSHEIRHFQARAPRKLAHPKHAERCGAGLTAAKMEDCRWIKPVLVRRFEFIEWHRRTLTSGTAYLWDCGRTKRRRMLAGDRLLKRRIRGVQSEGDKR
jgi:hypothetical protein